MTARWLMIAATAVSIAGTATAQQTPGNGGQSHPPAPPPAQVVLASAERNDEAQPPAAEAPTQAPEPAKRKRAARVTTCRCGDTGQ